MVFAYLVRCNFTAPDQEAAWNAWYGGPKIVQMLEQPYFCSCQRFRRVSGTGRNYLALWTVQSPQALQTPEYLSQWGFAAWSQYITDWSRDLFDGGDAVAADFAIRPDGALRVVSFEDLRDDAAQAARRDIAHSKRDIRWLPIAGLDRHTPLIGLQRLSAAPLPAAGEFALPPVRDGIYRPISEFHTARGEPRAGAAAS